MVEHGNLASFITASNEVFNVGYGSRVLQFAPFTFDASILEWATALSSGACLCFAEHPAALIGDYLSDVIDQNQVTFLHTTPTALSTLSTERVPESLRQISVGGEASPEGLLADWHRRVDIVNAYGPTEAS